MLSAQCRNSRGTGLVNAMDAMWLSRLWHSWRRRRPAARYPLVYRRADASDEPGIPTTKSSNSPAGPQKQHKTGG
jgi:hypothetical protein